MKTVHKLDRLLATMTPQSRMSKNFVSMMKELGLVDVWHHLHPSDRDFTFMSQEHGSYSRIDYLFISKKDTYRIKDSIIEPILVWDHSPVTMKINLGLDKCFKYWRLNVSLLTDTHIKQEIQLAIFEYFSLTDNGTDSPSVLWDAGKATIRGKIISIGLRLKKQRLAKQRIGNRN